MRKKEIKKILHNLLKHAIFYGSPQAQRMFTKKFLRGRLNTIGSMQIDYRRKLEST